jgi:hypothetical protein
MFTRLIFVAIGFSPGIHGANFEFNFQTIFIFEVFKVFVRTKSNHDENEAKRFETFLQEFVPYNIRVRFHPTSKLKQLQ